VLAENVEPELIGPPVTVLAVVSACCIDSVDVVHAYLCATRCGVGHTHRALCGFLSDATHCDVMCDAVMGFLVWEKRSTRREEETKENLLNAGRRGAIGRG